jgi:hypothetical protein
MGLARNTRASAQRTHDGAASRPRALRRLSASWLAVLTTLLCGCCATAGAQSARTVSTRERFLSDQRALANASSAPRRANRSALPSGHEIAALSFRECRRLLERSRVSFEAVPDDAAPHVYEPVYLLSPLSGVSFGPKNGASEHGMVDCRLAVALLAWAPILQNAGVVRVEHYSTYRRGARIARSSRSSGHARALAIDAARFHLEDGRVLDIDADWDERERGGDPCKSGRREDQAGRLLRGVVCEAVQRGLFQVVLTPHHDRAHQNHVHLELVPDVDWTYVH